MWKSGMMLRQRSAGERASVAPMWRAEARRFFWLRGTIFGREVVPEVCRTSATSSGSAGPPDSAAAMPVSSASRVKPPDGSVGPTLRRMTRAPCRRAAATAGPSSRSPTISALAPRSPR